MTQLFFALNSIFKPAKAHFEIQKNSRRLSHSQPKIWVNDSTWCKDGWDYD